MTAKDNLWFGWLARLRDLLAACPTWQDLCEATGTPEEKITTALEHIHIAEIERGDKNDKQYLEYLVSIRPFSVIDQGQGFERILTSRCGYEPTAGLFWAVEVARPEAHTSLAETQEWFMCEIGELVGEMEALSGANPADYLTLHSISLLDGPIFSEHSETITVGEFIQAFFQLTAKP